MNLVLKLNNSPICGLHVAALLQQFSANVVNPVGWSEKFF
jgi:hypothetical protein